MLKRILLDHWFLKLLSVAFAAMLWIYVAGNETTSSMSLEALLEFRNAPLGGMGIVNRRTTRVTVFLSGPANVVRDLSARPLFASVDVSQLAVGENTVSLGPENFSLPAGVEVLGITPQEVKIQIIIALPAN